MAIVASVQESIDDFNDAMLGVHAALDMHYRKGRKVSFIPNKHMGFHNAGKARVTATIVKPEVMVASDEHGRPYLLVQIHVSIDDEFIKWAQGHTDGHDRYFLNQNLRLTATDLDITLES
jgi:hypothetical protein